MSTFKRILESKSEISQKDMKRLQRAAAAKTPEQAKEILKNLESTQDRATRTTRTVPSAKSPKTVEQTPLNKYIRGEAEQGRRVSQELGDAAGVRDAARRGEIKPVQAGGETKPASGETNRARARGAAARQGVDISAPESKLKPRGQRLGDTTKGGPVRVIKPTQPAPAPKPEAVKKPVPTVSRRGALSKKVDVILKDLKSQGASQRALQTRMSAGYDKTLKATGDAVLKQVQGTRGVSQADASVRQKQYRASVATPPKPTAPPKLTPKALTPPKVTAPPKVTPKVTVNKTDAPFTGRRSPDTSRFQRIRQMKGATLDMAPPTKVSTSVGSTKVTGAYSGPQPKAPPTVKADPVPKARSFSARDVQRRARRMNLSRLRRTASPGPLGIAFGAYDAWDELDARSKAYKSAGGSGKTTTKDKWRAGVKGLASTLGYSVGAAAAAPIALAPVPGARVAAFGAGMYTGSKASDYAVKQAERAFDATYDTVAGATDWQKKQMAAANRRVQGAGTSTQSASFKSGNRAIVRDSSGRERIGYKTIKTGPDGTKTTTYKHGNDPKALRYTSSNPLERMGRGIGDSNVPWLSGALKKYYSNKDETNRQRRVSNFKRAVAAGVTPK